MNSKWFLFIFAVLGIVAATSAAVLMGTLRHRGSAAANTGPAASVTIVLAAEALPAATVVGRRSVATKTVPKAQAPPDFVPSAAQVVGKVLAVPMTEGQAFTKGCFVTQGSGPQLAAALPKGMRAVAISLPGWSGLESVLYPGAVVDVHVSFNDPGSPGKPVISTVLVQGVQVLAVERRTVFAADDQKGESRTIAQRLRLVTLMVNSDQARALQLAMQHGTLSLTLRNPLDRETVNAQPMLMSEILKTPQPEQEAEPPKEPEPVVERPAPQPEAPRPPPRWEVVIIRGGRRETQSFELPAQDTGSGKAAPR